jgi:hypothetical protein
MLPRTKTFHIDYHSAMEEKHYRGTFTVRKLTIGDLSKLGLIKAKMADGLSYNESTGMGIDDTTNAINEMLAHFELALIQKPEWFVPEDMIDLGILREVYSEVASFEADFLNRSIQGEGSSEVSADASSEQHRRGGGELSSPENLVDEEIPKITQVG